MEYFGSNENQAEMAGEMYDDYAADAHIEWEGLKSEFVKDYGQDALQTILDNTTSSEEAYEMMLEVRACDHVCSGNCRREGCNCSCGEFHLPKLNSQ